MKWLPNYLGRLLAWMRLQAKPEMEVNGVKSGENAGCDHVFKIRDHLIEIRDHKFRGPEGRGTFHEPAPGQREGPSHATPKRE
jgi:hypothetical protein